MKKNIKDIFKNFNIFWFCFIFLLLSLLYCLIMMEISHQHDNNKPSEIIAVLKEIKELQTKSTEESKKESKESKESKEDKTKIIKIKKFDIHETSNYGSYLIVFQWGTGNKDSFEWEKELKFPNVDQETYKEIMKICFEIIGTPIDKKDNITNLSQMITKIKEKTNLIPLQRIPYQPYFGFAPFISAVNICILIIIFYFIYNSIEKTSAQISGKNLNISRQKVLVNQQEFTFKDIAGADEEKEEMSELINFLKNPFKYEAMGARIPKGVLLYGPPGVGKTLLAKAVAGEAKVPFFAVSGSDFIEVYVGLGASRIRKLFNEAKQNAPCIIFIDEIETISHQRGSVNYSNSEHDQTLNQLLVEMDGFTKNIGVIVMAATNQPESLDLAVTRPGRFDRHFHITLPSVKDREAILKLHARNKKFNDDVDFESLAKQTPGFNGAQLEAILNESALLATRRNVLVICNEDISEALDRVLMGPSKKSKKYNDKEKRMVAYHESGHAVIGLKLPEADQIQKVTIIPRGNAGGYNLTLPQEETFFSSKKRLLAQITSFLGGRAAEEVVFQDVSNGAYSDFKYATEIAKKMVTQYGMSDLGPIQYMENNFYKNFSDSKAVEIDKEIQKIIDYCYQNAKKIITENRDLLDLISKYLLEIETITQKDLEEILNTGIIEWWEKDKLKKNLQKSEKEDCNK
ncbi:HflB protease [Candidatus Phytoplasma mali]|uniref:ATP-dependent zinc metalloprotease FtsH 2 n=1 Tax=Phytoplasma mali (strain AT) TaxID=482235 RepID=FTSH2_PHYMT|nr:ATP-dependent zinc metalloprotease FtsH [Candidatus Phytoplasma mali]B3QZS3.1 RecName: Full=ATP-dependent zinc metalloprotease FtsH 2 [Candidatus Phytoplasma mali AT]CAP18460.1 HflB protease [Candidatus Phytoplasma mali]